jgi:two-component system, chemotaxis family, chemotaxis protein CheY
MFPQTTRILIVDDLQSLRELLRAHLRRMGFLRIEEAEDGHVALTMLLAAKETPNPFQMVISDWNMPNMEGLELLQKIRAIPDWKTLPVFLLTTESEKPKVVEAVMAGVTNYMIKPVDEAMLKDKLGKAWEKIKATAK